MCPAAVVDPHLGEGDVYYCDGGPDEVYGVHGAFGLIVEVPAEVWLVSMAWCGEGRRSWRWFHRRVLLFVGMSIWWNIQRVHVLRARCAAWRRIVAPS